VVARRERRAYLHDPLAACDVGFKVRQLSRLDVESLAALWEPPKFMVPMPALSEASAGEVILAARARFGDRPTISHEFFARAAEASGEEALDLWLCCLEAGGSVAHWGVGARLYELGRYGEVYRHLCCYTEISPELSRGWWWYGRAAEALGRDSEALRAYRKAVPFEQLEGEEAGAADWLEDLEGCRAARPRRCGRRRRRR
jgi:tetratricopeptide (TPR) repeat protein